MENIAKYFVLLENLTFENAYPSHQKLATSEMPPSLLANLQILKKYVQKDVQQQLQELCAGLQLSSDNYKIMIDECVNGYIIRLLHVLHTLMNNIKFHSDAKEDLISVAHLKLCIQTTQELAFYALRMQLHTDFYKSPLYKETPAVDQLRCDLPLILLSIQFFTHLLLPIRQFHIGDLMVIVKRDLVAAIVSARMHGLQPDQVLQLNKSITYLWENESKVDFFRHLLMLKATDKLCAPLAMYLHRMLLKALCLEHSFASLVAALTSFPNVDATRNAEAVAKIVTQIAIKAEFRQHLVNQIFDFCRQVTSPNILVAGTLSLRRLCELDVENRERIEQILTSHWQPLSSPQDLLNGLIVWDQAELFKCITLWQRLFCISSVACLPSALLVPHLPLLMQLHQQLPEELPERQHLASLITRCLDNRETSKELPALLLRIYKWDKTAFKFLHPRLTIVQTDQLKVQVSGEERKSDQECCSLTSILISGSDQALTCKIFLALLDLMLQQLATGKGPASTDLLSTEAELADFLHTKYQLKLQLLTALQQLIGHQPLKTQLATTMHSKQFMQLIAKFLEQQLCQTQEPESEQTLLLMLLLLLQELLEKSQELQLAESTQRLKQLIQQLLTKQKDNPTVKNTLLPLVALLDGQTPNNPPALAAFQQARELIEDQQPHLQVNGIQLMIDALHKKDPAFISQAPRIIALALSTLKNKESYTFLNCVRLFVALVHVMESEVLDMLSDEYLSETADLDYRLVVGEAILKAANEIGPLCYRYKAVLFNCFLHGARSPLNEFRSSAYANLAQLCRLLAYQVHSFFQELMQLIDGELSNGSYIPAKRGALLVLAELLAGMESLLDYQDMLLPIYRLLRAIEAAESVDPQMRQHAANGLNLINEKCIELLSKESDGQLKKEIKVLGIKEDTKPQKKHILALN